MSKNAAETDDVIFVKGARVNNLKNIDIAIPREKLVVITGLSGSGKSSLAFDTLFAEGQRRYVESLSSYARQFLGRMNKPDVDYITGLSPAVAIEQKVNTRNPRSTVGTSTEIYEYIKLLYARIGRTYSPVSGVEVVRHSVSDVVLFIMGLPDGTKLHILSKIANPNKAEALELLKQQGFARVSVDGAVMRIDEALESGILINQPLKVLLVVDRISVRKEDEGFEMRVADSVQTAFHEGEDECRIEVEYPDGKTELQEFSNRFELDGIYFEKPNVNFFSFNNPYGACQTCGGYGSCIGISEDLVIPNKQLSIYENAVICWKGEKMSEWKDALIKVSERINFPIHKPYKDLTEEQRDLLWNGNNLFEGIYDFFTFIETQTYKIQYRVMLSRFRGRTVCPDCKGTRLRKDASYVKIDGKSIIDLVLMPISDLKIFFENINLTSYEKEVSKRIMTELQNRLQYMLDVGLGYLTLNRLSGSLSGGESQRINLATSLGSSLVGSMYILDEPSIGLHSRDTHNLIKVLTQLRDLGNTVVVVEHDEEIMKAADYIIDIGPMAGRLGGEIVFTGTFEEMLNKKVDTLTAKYLRKEMFIPVPERRRKWRDYILIEGAYEHNLKYISAKFPLKAITVVSGVSGSGKTSLVKHVLHDVLYKRFDGAMDYMGKCLEMKGSWNMLTGVELVDQNPIGRSSRSNPATYLKAYDDIRQLFASQPLAKKRGYKPGFFSFNTAGGRCDTCEGEGYVTIPMQFMADVHLLCEECHGTRFKEDVLEIKYKDHSISDILNLTVGKALELFSSDPASITQKIAQRLKPLKDVGLDYLKMGQSSSSLSGGEAQRIKLAYFLTKGESRDSILFIFDEPSTGLHFHDIQKLIDSLNTLVEQGHSIVIIEHHPDIIKIADHIIDMGTEGGNNGGNVVFEGCPEDILNCKESHTGTFLKKENIFERMS